MSAGGHGHRGSTVVQRSPYSHLLANHREKTALTLPIETPLISQVDKQVISAHIWNKLFKTWGAEMQKNEIEKWRAWKKEHPDFPLTVAPCGQWQKKVRGRTYYFGSLADPAAALTRWRAEKDFLLSSLTPPERMDGQEIRSQAVSLEQVAERLLALCGKADIIFARCKRVMDGPHLYTVEEAAEVLGITRRQVISLLTRGELPWINVSKDKQTSKPRKRISEADLNRFIEMRRVEPPPKPLRWRRRQLPPRESG